MMNEEHLLTHYVRQFMVATWNARGLMVANNEIRERKLKFLEHKTRNIDVFAIKEAHLDLYSFEEFSLWCLQHRFEFFHTPAWDGRLGGVILIRSVLAAKFHITHFEIEKHYDRFIELYG